jgi:TRAP-type C4-dicarboxylate transport system permease small subunit
MSLAFKKQETFFMTNFMSAFDSWLIRLNRWAVQWILAAMAVMVFANVALRFLTDNSILWVEELSRYLMIWLTFIGAGLVLRYGGHIGIENLQENLPTHARLIRGIVFVLMLAFFVFMFVVGVRYAAFTWGQTTPVMQIPVGAVYLAMPIGFALLILHALIMARGYIRDKTVLADQDFDAEAAASV